MRISEMIVTPVAAKDPPLRNSTGVHHPYCLRTILRLKTDDGLEGVGETSGGKSMLDALEAARPHVVGEDPWQLERLWNNIENVRSFSPVEQACLDIIGKASGKPVCDVIGGRCRDRVEFSAYLFFKYDALDGWDTWGEVMSPEAMVEEARTFISRWGFKSLKLKGGVLPPNSEMETLRLLNVEFPESRLRIDPNAIWTVDTSIHVGKQIGHLLEYYEDPTAGQEGMSMVQHALPDVLLATNMCVTRWEHVRPGYDCDCVRVILVDHHAGWGGIVKCKQLAQTCLALDWETSMHSNNHLGISMAAMTHLGAAIPNMDFACDSHYPWQTEDVIQGDRFEFKDGCLDVPTTPGLGVTIDEDKLAALHENYVKSQQHQRDDISEMRKYDPAWEPMRPRW